VCTRVRVCGVTGVVCVGRAAVGCGVCVWCGVCVVYVVCEFCMEEVAKAVASARAAQPASSDTAAPVAPHAGSDTPHAGSDTPHAGSDTPHAGSDTPHAGSDTAEDYAKAAEAYAVQGPPGTGKTYTLVVGKSYRKTCTLVALQTAKPNKLQVLFNCVFVFLFVQHLLLCCLERGIDAQVHCITNSGIESNYVCVRCACVRQSQMMCVCHVHVCDNRAVQCACVRMCALCVYVSVCRCC
jgi:hypothetical protein